MLTTVISSGLGLELPLQISVQYLKISLVSAFLLCLSIAKLLFLHTDRLVRNSCDDCSPMMDSAYLGQSKDHQKLRDLMYVQYVDPEKHINGTYCGSGTATLSRSLSHHLDQEWIE